MDSLVQVVALSRVLEVIEGQGPNITEKYIHTAKNHGVKSECMMCWSKKKGTATR